MIVIGTGVGGTAAGALLAREGWRVLFLEKNPRPGGACSFYVKEGVHVDLGAHFFSSGNCGPIGEVQRRLGSRQLVRFVDSEPLLRLQGPGVDLSVSLRLRSLLGLFPDLLRQTGIPAREIPGLLGRMLLPVALPDRGIETLDSRSVEDYFLAGTDRARFLLVISIFMGLYFVIPYMQASLGEATWCTKKALQAREPGYPLGGAVAVPLAFLEAARALGARVRLNARAARIRVEGGRVAGVEDAEGRFFSGRVVVSNTSLRDTVRLAGEEQFPPAYRQQVEESRGSLSAVQAKILLDRPLVREGILVGIRDRRASPGGALTAADVRLGWEDIEAGRVPRVFSFYCPVPTNFDPGLAPRGMQLLTVTSCLPGCDRVSVDGPQVWIDAMLETLFEIRPDLREHVVWIDRFDNRFLESWLGKQGGPVISTCQDTRQVGRQRQPQETPLTGLFVVGDSAGGRGIGTELACRSGMEGADLVMRALRCGGL